MLCLVFLIDILDSLLFQMSKESTLTDTIDYIRQLQKEVLDLQTELADEEGEKQGSASSSPETMAPLQNAQYQVH